MATVILKVKINFKREKIKVEIKIYKLDRVLSYSIRQAT